MPIKVFVFDCGGVLLRDGDLTPYERWGERLGLRAEELADRLWRGDLWALAETGQLSDREFWLRAGQELGLDDAQTAALREELWNTWLVDERVLALIDRIRERYPVWMLSNATDALESLLKERFRVADRFERILTSARLGVAKPKVEVFQELLRQLALEPGEVVFVDDRAENVAAAASLGMHVIWFIHASELERQLRPYLRQDGDGSCPAKHAEVMEDDE
ncbi:MAG: HAD family phosphatase [Chloroflexi bacterium]|nr:HAD family phosphatase [Chloroflexota bacterium]